MYGTAPSRLSCRAMYGTAPSRVCLVVHTSGQAKLVLSRYRTHARVDRLLTFTHHPHTKRVLVTGTQTRSLFRRVRVRPRPVAGAGVSSPARPPDACGGCGVAQWHPASRRPHTLVGVWLVHIRAMADAPCAGARWRGATCSVVGPASGSAAIGQVRHVKRTAVFQDSAAGGST